MRLFAKYPFFMAVAAALAVASAYGAPVAPDDASTAARNWLARRGSPMRVRFGSGAVAQTHTFTNETGVAAFHVVEMAGGGYVVTSGDTLLPPVVAFSGSKSPALSAGSALRTLLERDMARRADAAGAAGVALRRKAPANASSFECQWADLLAEAAGDAGRPMRKAAFEELPDVRVEPLVSSLWGQGEWNGEKTFNLYTPSNYICGCVATAGAQIMRFWKKPVGEVTPGEYACTIDGKPVRLSMFGGVYDWENMPKLDVLCESESQRQAIGKLTYDLGVASMMDWAEDGSGTMCVFAARALRERFGYASATSYYDWFENASLNQNLRDATSFRNAILGSLDAGMPALLGLNGAETGHAVVVDGYGFDGESDLIYCHLNCGWEGDEDLWYNLVGESLTSFELTYMDECVYNIHPDVPGDVLSGRVLDVDGKPVSDAVVTLKPPSGEPVEAKSDACGIYFFRIVAAGGYDVTATAGDLSSAKSHVTVVLSKNDSVSKNDDGSLTASDTVTPGGILGNTWGVDLVVTDEPPPEDPEEPEEPDPKTHVTTAVAADCKGMGTVTGLDKTVDTGATVTLKATAAKGAFFAGWYENGEPAETVSDYRVAANTYVTKGGEAVLEARFVKAPDDFLWFDVSDDLAAFALGETVSVALGFDSDTLPTVKFTNLPKGLSFDAKTLVLSGKPTVEGRTYVTVYAKNASGYEYTQVVDCTVGKPAEPAENPYADLVAADAADNLLDLFVGESVGNAGDLGSALCLGRYSASSKEGITKVAGLPAGLKSVTAKSGDVTTYYVVGTPTKPGVSTVTVTCSRLNDNKKAVTGTVKLSTVVGTGPSVYLSVSSASADGTASGSGVYAYGATAKLTAKAASKRVFVGWYPDAEGEEPLDGDVDYRNPSRQVPIVGDVPTTWVARFAKTTDDAAIAVAGDGFAAGDVVAFAPDGKPFALSYAVSSASLPTVKVTGLPDGFTFDKAAVDGWFGISYDPATAKKTPFPGVYEVKIAASNVSKASAVLAFSLKVANWTSEFIQIADVYPNEDGFVPGAAIVPIDFSGAVAEGFTLSVSGLPKGLTFNQKANAKKGIAANTVTGTPTKPGPYTVTFTAKKSKSETYQATATFVVAPLPTLAVPIDADAAAAGCKVTGAGGYLAGAKATLKATAAKGWVFAGWDVDDDSIMTRLNPTLSLVTGVEDAEVRANFIRICDDWIWICDYNNGETPKEEGETVDSATLKIPLNTDVAKAGLAGAFADLVDSGSLPTVKVENLPSGLKFDSKTLLLSGKATKKGISYVTVSAKNVGGYTHSIVVRVAVLDSVGNEPVEAEPVNTAGVDMSGLDEWGTGDYLESSLKVPDAPECSATGCKVKSVSFSGLPKGISYKLYEETAAEDEEDNGTYVFVYGQLTKAGRYPVKLTVTYKSGTKAVAEHNIRVWDNGSTYLFVKSEDAKLGTVTGEGVYAYGSTVKLVAKAAKKNVFTGWHVLWKRTSCHEDGEEECVVEEGLDPLPDYLSPVDYRSPTLSFTMSNYLGPKETIVGTFAPSADDTDVEIWIDGEFDDDDVWEIRPDEFGCAIVEVESASLPTVTVSGLPKGLSYDKTYNEVVYDPDNKAKLVPGVYRVSVTAKNASGVKDTAEFWIRVPVPKSAFFQEYELNQDKGYVTYTGLSSSGLVALSGVYDSLVNDGYEVTFKGLPTGLKAVKKSSICGIEYLIDGKATKTGAYTVTITATGTRDGKKVTEKSQFFLTVANLPEEAVGTFNGVLYAGDPDDPADGVKPVGSFVVTATSAGKISATVVRPTGTYTFATTGWDDVDMETGFASVWMIDSKNDADLYIGVDLFAGKFDWHLSGRFYTDGDCDNQLYCRAQRNTFAADGGNGGLPVLDYVKGTYLFAAAGAEETASGAVYSFMYNDALTAETADLSLTIDAKGVATFAGKALDRTTKTVSGSTVLVRSLDEEGPQVLTARLVQKYDDESVLIGTVRFLVDVESGDCSMDNLGDSADAMFEIYRSDPAE